MKLLVFGKTGQVARELARAMPTEWNVTFLGREQADLEHPDQCAVAISDLRPDAVINAAAFTGVDKAEDEPEVAQTVNALAPAAMATAAQKLNVPFLHISTDYVFDGSGSEAFSPADPTGPLGVYGHSKLAGEQAIAEAGGKWFILRTSWVFSGHGANFARTMLRLGAERDSLGVVEDQIGGPTPASEIAQALVAAARAMVDGQSGGIYHFAGAPFTSWASFARAIMDNADLDCRIDGIATSGYPTPAERPRNSRLDCESFEQDFGIDRPKWRKTLPQVISELIE